MEKIKCTHCSFDNPIDAKYCSRCGYALPVVPVETVEEVQKAKKKALTKEQRKSRIIGVVFTMIGGTFGATLVQKTLFPKPSIDGQLMAIAGEFNKHCPFMADADTRVDNAIAGPNHTIVYNYTLVNLAGPDIDTSLFRETILPNIVNNARTSPAMKEFRKEHVTMVYNYRDKSGAFVYKASVTPEMYAE